jgi:CBS domain-containing protein
VYHALLEQNRVYLPGGETRVSSNGTRARDIMSQTVPFIPETAAVQDAWKIVEDSKVGTFLVGAPDQLFGTVTRDKVEQAIKAGHGADSIQLYATREFQYLHADQPLELVLERFGGSLDLLPVISRQGAKVEGVVTLNTILEFIQNKPV